MVRTHSKMHMHDMIKINIIVFEIVGGGDFKTPLIVNCLKYPRLDRVNYKVSRN